MMQAAVQSIVVSTLIPDPGQALTRWTDAVIGGAVALVAATVVPAAPLRRPREQAARVVRKVAELLRAAGDVMVDGVVDRALALLADARSTDHLITELRAAADEGLSVVASSPFRVRHKGGLRRMADLVDPIDRALRSTRVLVRRTAVTAYRHREVPRSYALLCRDLADAVDEVADELMADRMAVGARPALLAVGVATGLGRADGRPHRRGGAGPDPRRRRRPAAAHRARRARGHRRAAAAAGADGLSRDRRVGAPRRPRHVPGGGRGAAPARAGRQAGGGRRPRNGHRARGGLDGVVRGAGVRDPVGDAAADGVQEVPRRGVPAGRLPGLQGRLGGGDGDAAVARVGWRAGRAGGARLGRGVRRCGGGARRPR